MKLSLSSSVLGYAASKRLQCDLIPGHPAPEPRPEPAGHSVFLVKVGLLHIYQHILPAPPADAPAKALHDQPSIFLTVVANMQGLGYKHESPTLPPTNPGAGHTQAAGTHA